MLKPFIIDINYYNGSLYKRVMFQTKVIINGSLKQKGIIRLIITVIGVNIEEIMFQTSITIMEVKDRSY